ncbi:O-methyltransferase [Pyrenochaeta sp. DS3sAY3a]|nr:O-methyltransferase [Pyrenochaeta sp. DS3sAY3a]
MDSQLNLDINELHTQASEFKTNDERQRLNLLRLAQSIVTQLEKPHERVMRMLYHEPALFMASKVLSDLGIFRILATSSEPRIAGEIARDVGADRHLVERLLKHAATASFVEETGPDTYRANEITRCCATPGAKGAIDDIFQAFPVVGAVPQFLKDTNYANPTDKNNTAWKVAYKTDQHFFEYVNTPGREDKLEALRNHMSFKTVGLRWFEVPELMESLFSEETSSKEHVALIDVGGSGGHDLLAFREAMPSVSGRLILQDLPTTIDSLDRDKFARKGIELMGHDFFTPQPVHGAKVYYLKMCLHDWPDKQCSEILAQLRSAMTPGLSRILLDEIIIPDEGASWFETSVDLLMMNVHSAQERREKEWKALVEGVSGLQLKQIWNLEGGFNKIIELVAV